MNGAEDPTTMRSVAAQLRRESDQVLVTVGGVQAHIAGMSYTGPAADQFRQAVGESNIRASSVAAELAELAAILEREAYEAEVRAVALRAAGLLS